MGGGVSDPTCVVIWSGTTGVKREFIDGEPGAIIEDSQPSPIGISQQEREDAWLADATAAAKEFLQAAEAGDDQDLIAEKAAALRWELMAAPPTFNRCDWDW